MVETPNHGYNVPERGTEDWHEPLNENFRQYDTDIEIRDRDANRSNYDPRPGAKFFATDTERIYIGDGTSWNRLATSGQQPTFGGTIYRQRGKPTTRDLADGEVMTYNSDGSDGHAAGDLVYAINDGGTIATAVIVDRGDASGGGSSSVLTQPLPDPEEYITDGSNRDDNTRSIGTVRIDTGAGTLVLDGPGGGEITAIAGYLLADDLAPNDDWGRVVNNDTKLIGTNATFGEDSLSFASSSFQGIALRAVQGIRLRIDGESIASEVSLVRYSTDRGVFERSPA